MKIEAVEGLPNDMMLFINQDLLVKCLNDAGVTQREVLSGLDLPPEKQRKLAELLRDTFAVTIMKGIAV